jgi:hypothetical protein
MSITSFFLMDILGEKGQQALGKEPKSQELQTTGPSTGVRNAYDVGGGKKS